MKKTIKTVAVIGAGTMGCGIASHIANAGFNVLLLDMVTEGQTRDYITSKALEKMIHKSSYYFTTIANAERIIIGNLEDDIARLSQVDWIIEAVTENIGIKHSLYRKVEKYCNESAVLSSNTSTFTIDKLSECLSQNMKNRFFITHFFNPPRYMPLLELVSYKSGPMRDSLVKFCEDSLGRLVVPCKDTPGFIANRIGCAWLAIFLNETEKYGISISKMDAAITHIMNVPKTGIFGLLDLIGLDVFSDILKAMRSSLPSNDWLYKMVDDSLALHKMINSNWIGNKTKIGFYSNNDDGTKDELDWESMQHVACKKHSIGTLQEIMSGKDDFSMAMRNGIAKSLLYAYYVLPQISDNVLQVDMSMRSGYNWQEGPFQMIDRISEQLGSNWLNQEAIRLGMPIALAEHYYTKDAKCLSTDLKYTKIPEHILKYDIDYLRRSGGEIMRNDSAVLVELSHDVACFTITNKNKTIDTDLLVLLDQSLDYILKNQYKGMIISSGENFCLGADIKDFVGKAEKHDYDGIAELIRYGTQIFAKLRGLPIPVVAAVSGMALGGGCELLMHCARAVVHSNAKIGLVEPKIGLIPGWGGCREMLYRVSKDNITMVMEQIINGKVSSSAEEAKNMLYLSKEDLIIMNQLQLLPKAEEMVVDLYDSGYQPQPRASFSQGIKSYADLLDAHRIRARYSEPIDNIAKGVIELYKQMDSFGNIQERVFLDLIKTPYAMQMMHSVIKN